MARRRMFSLDIVDSDMFLDMPKTSQALYFNLGMRADDDGFIQNPKRLLKMLGTEEDDLKILIAKGFVIRFETGVIVITHWKQNNYIAKDRYKETVHKIEKRLLNTDENNTYFITQSECIQPVYGSVYNLDTQDRLVKDRVVKDRVVVVEEDKYIPQLEEIKNYINNNNYTFDPEYFFNYYKTRNWNLGNKPINSFDQLKSIMDNWQKRERQKSQNDLQVVRNSFNNFDQKIYTEEEIDERLREKGQTCI